MPKKPRSKTEKIPRLDLHGKTAEEVAKLLDPFLLNHQNHEQVAIICGKGRGIVRKEVLDYLKKAGYNSWSYEKIRGQTNEGCIIVNME